MTTLRTPTENFLSTPACPFRRVNFGSAHCTISTDSHVSEVDPLTCHNCDIPGIIAQPRCRYLSLGTELKPYRGEGKLVCAMACRALNIKLYSLKTCDECPLYAQVDALSDVLKSDESLASVQIPVSEALVERVAQDIRMDYGVRDSETPPLKPIRCWRFPEGHCRKFPIYTPRKVTVALRLGERNNDLYIRAISPTIREMNLIPYRLEEELRGAEEMCRGCENFQESDHVIASLDDWDVNSMFMTGVVYGLGKRVILLKNQSLHPVPLLEQMEHDVIHYSSVEDLQERLRDRLSIIVGVR
jgi:hypothetical protein